MDGKTAMLYFRIRRRYKIDDIERCTLLIRQLVARKKVRYIRNAEEFLEGKNVLRISAQNKPKL